MKKTRHSFRSTQLAVWLAYGAKIMYPYSYVHNILVKVQYYENSKNQKRHGNRVRP